MALSIFLARVLGLYLIIVGFFYLFRGTLIKKIAVQIYENEAFSIITAFIPLIIGLLIVVGHNVWEWKWTLIITLLGYLSLIKGLMRLFIPSRVDKKMIMKVIAKNNPIYIGLFCLIIGFLLTYEGFFGAV